MAENRRPMDPADEGRKDYFMDVDRMVNEGLGGGIVTRDNGLIEDTTVDTMNMDESALRQKDESRQSGPNGAK
jgi:hypothetical protein